MIVCKEGVKEGNMGLLINKKKKYQKFLGWRMLALLWFLYLMVQGFIVYGEPVMNSLMILDEGYSRTILGAGTCVFLLVQAATGPFAAKAVYKWGVQGTVTLGGAFILICSLLMGFWAHSPLTFLISFGVFSGIGVGLAGQFSMMSGINYWFKEHRALALSIAATGSGFGGYIAGHLMNTLYQVTGDWRMGWHFITMTALLTIILAALFLVNRPEDVGQIPDGKTFDDVRYQKRFSKVYKVEGNIPYAKVIRDFRFWFVVFTLMFFTFSYTMATSIAMVHLLEVGIAAAISATAVGLMNLTGVFGRMITGGLGDKIEPRGLTVFGILLTIGGFYALWQAAAPIYSYLYSIGVGVGYGFIYVATTAALSNYFGVDTFPSLMAIVYPARQIFGAIGPLIAGAIYDASGSYDGAFKLGLVSMAVSAVCMLFVVLPKEGVKWKAEMKKSGTHKIA